MLFRAPKSWSSDAACHQLGEEEKKWFYTDGGSGHKKAKAICQRCPAMAKCLETAMALESPNLDGSQSAFVGPRGDRFGVWGGLTGRERTRLARGTA